MTKGEPELPGIDGSCRCLNVSHSPPAFRLMSNPQDTDPRRTMDQEGGTTHLRQGKERDRRPPATSPDRMAATVMAPVGSSTSLTQVGLKRTALSISTLSPRRCRPAWSSCRHLNRRTRRSFLTIRQEMRARNASGFPRVLFLVGPWMQQLQVRARACAGCTGGHWLRTQSVGHLRRSGRRSRMMSRGYAHQVGTRPSVTTARIEQEVGVPELTSRCTQRAL